MERDMFRSLLLEPVLELFLLWSLMYRVHIFDFRLRRLSYLSFIMIRYSRIQSWICFIQRAFFLCYYASSRTSMSFQVQRFFSIISYSFVISKQFEALFELPSRKLVRNLPYQLKISSYLSALLIYLVIVVFIQSSFYSTSAFCLSTWMGTLKGSLHSELRVMNLSQSRQIRRDYIQFFLRVSSTRIQSFKFSYLSSRIRYFSVKQPIYRVSASSGLGKPCSPSAREQCLRLEAPIEQEDALIFSCLVIQFSFLAAFNLFQLDFIVFGSWSKILVRWVLSFMDQLGLISYFVQKLKMHSVLSPNLLNIILIYSNAYSIFCPFPSHISFQTFMLYHLMCSEIVWHQIG